MIHARMFGDSSSPVVRAADVITVLGGRCSTTASRNHSLGQRQVNSGHPVMQWLHAQHVGPSFIERAIPGRTFR